MPKRKATQTKVNRSLPALSPAAKENEMISLAMDCAEQQMRDGTASSAVLVHFLKLGTEKSKVELAKLEHETALLQAKTTALESSARNEELTAKVLDALKLYGGASDD